MNRILFPVIFWFAFFILSCNSNKNNEESPKPYVVMLSMDGFRWDYTTMTETPNFDKIAAMGVKAESLQPSFPTKTFPNHYSMATGLYPDHHGIVLNSFYDPEMDAYYKISDRKAVKNGEFYGGEPIWNTAIKQGVTTASFFWVGSEARIQGMQPSYWREYDGSVPYTDRINKVIKWLQLPEDERPHLITWYFDEPDHTGHLDGPNSEEIKIKVHYLDSLLGIFMNKIATLPNKNEINIIITSDHGMGETSNDKKIALSDYLAPNWVETIIGGNPNWNIKATDGSVDPIVNALSKVEHVHAWKNSEVPDELNYGTNPRTLDVVVTCDVNWSIVSTPDFEVNKGAHGYINSEKDMHAIFYAYGPAFKENYTHPTFENVDIYPLICKILNLKPAPVDGKLERVEGMLR